MMTLYCYEELSFRIQQEVAERVKQTTAYKKYVKSFYKERLTEILRQDFMSSEITADTVTVYSLRDFYEEYSLDEVCEEFNNWQGIFNSITYNLDNKQIKVDVSVDETIDFNNLYDFIHSITYKFRNMMQNIIDEAISIEPDMGQFLTDKNFDETGREVEISFK